MAGNELPLKLADMEICVGWTDFWSGRHKDEVTVGPAPGCGGCMCVRVCVCARAPPGGVAHWRNQANAFLLTGRVAFSQCALPWAAGIC